MGGSDRRRIDPLDVFARLSRHTHPPDSRIAALRRRLARARCCRKARRGLARGRTAGWVAAIMLTRGLRRSRQAVGTAARRAGAAGRAATARSLVPVHATRATVGYAAMLLAGVPYLVRRRAGAVRGVLADRMAIGLDGLRADVARLQPRVGGVATATRRVATAARRQLRRAATATVDVARTAGDVGLGANGLAPAAVAVVIFLVAVAHGDLAHVAVRARPPIVPVASAGVTAVPVAMPAAGVAHAAWDLDDPALTEERRLAVVEEMGRDQRDATTDALLAAAESPSVVVAMASVRALRGRPCVRVRPQLVERLDDREWQRRAWAAKVLGENGCVAAAPELRRRLRHEPDARVRAQLTVALATLVRGTPG